MDWTSGTNWRNEDLKKKSAKMKGQIHFEGLGGNIKMHIK